MASSARRWTIRVAVLLSLQLPAQVFAGGDQASSIGLPGAPTATDLAAELLSALPGAVTNTSVESESSTLRRAANLVDLLGRKVVAIRFEGLRWTVAAVVRRELTIAEGMALRADALGESVQRLRNLGVFRAVDVVVEPSGPDGVSVRLIFDEKWTLMPIFQFSRRAGLVDFTLGVSDSNAFGQLWVLRGYYYNFAGTHSAFAEVADRRFLGQRLLLRVTGTFANLNRVLYQRTVEPVGAYSRRISRAAVIVNDERNPRLVYGLRLSWQQDDFSERLLDAATLDLNENLAYRVPAALQHGTIQANVRLGRLNYDDYLVHGAYIAASVTGSSQAWGSSSNFLRLYMSSMLALRARYRQNLVMRLSLGTVNREIAEQNFYVGGLVHIRGFANGQFRGNHMFNANVEYRVPSFHHRYLVLQHVAFCDVGNAANEVSTLLSVDGLPPFSVGTGVRLVAPLLANFRARFDVAFAFTDRVDYRISFGSQQFF